jgi:BMFP domain-containing protein YqiC
MSVYNSKAFEAAHRKFVDDAKTLSDEDLEQFQIVDPKLAERARARRAGFVESETEDEHKAFAQPATMRSLIDLYRDAIMPILATYRHKNAMLEERWLALEQRLTTMEQKPSVKFRGVYEQGKAYQPGDACTHSGGLWICRAATMGQPNQDYIGWSLAVKSRSIA